MKRAVAASMISMMTVIISTLTLSLTTAASFDVILYETVSATATVGLSKGLTATLDICGKLIVVATMFFGRIGPITLFVAFSKKNNKQNIIKNPVEEVSIG